MNAAPLVVDHRNVGAAFRRLSLPFALQMLGDQLLSLVDTIAIGALGTAQLAGATAATAIFFALIMTLAGFWSGTSIVASQRIGAGDYDGYGRTVRAGMAIPGIVAFVLACASIWGSAPLLERMLGPGDAVLLGTPYLIARMISLIPLNLSAVLVTAFGAAGNRKLGIVVLAAINVVHLPLLGVLAFGWGTGHAYGVLGAGMSSLIAELIGAFIALLYVAARPMYRVFARLDFDWQLALRCAWLGLPETVFGFTIIAPDIAIIALLAPLGPLTIAAFRALNVTSDFTFVVPSPLQNTTQVVIGQRIGARDIEGARSFLRSARRLSFWMSTAAAAVIAIAAQPFAYIMTLNAAAASMAALPLALHMVSLPIKTWAMVSLAPIRAAGDTRFSLILGVLCAALVIPIAAFAIRVAHVGLFAVPIAWIAAWLARALITEVKLAGGSWTRRAPVRV